MCEGKKAEKQNVRNMFKKTLDPLGNIEGSDYNYFKVTNV